MSETKAFLSEHVANNDLVIAEILGEPQPQSYTAKLKKIYTARKGVKTIWLGSDIDFVGGIGTWGQETLNVGETAVIFLRSISGQLYESSWRGHMVIEEINGVSYAVFQYKELWLSKYVSESLRVHAQQDPKRSYASVIRFDVLEAYLLDLIKQADHGAM